MSDKLRLAFFDFTCCEGCQLMFMSCEDELPQLLKSIEIVNFREVSSLAKNDYDIAFVEGSVSRESEMERLEVIRERARKVVAFGSCAAIGGINCIKNRFGMEEVKGIVYGAEGDFIDTIPARPIDAVIPVDYYIYGCPVSKGELLHVLKALIMGVEPSIPNYPVCTECKMAENQCVYEKGLPPLSPESSSGTGQALQAVSRGLPLQVLSRGITCLGPITRAGCNAICITYGARCWGCRGLADEANLVSIKDVMERYGLSPEDLLKEFYRYYGWKKD